MVAKYAEKEQSLIPKQTIMLGAPNTCLSFKNQDVCHSRCPHGACSNTCAGVQPHGLQRPGDCGAVWRPHPGPREEGSLWPCAVCAHALSLVRIAHSELGDFIEEGLPGALFIQFQRLFKRSRLVVRLFERICMAGIASLPSSAQVSRSQLLQGCHQSKLPLPNGQVNIGACC
eukprot:1154561-Pelagomonas_calceolata.AAC.3